MQFPESVPAKNFPDYEALNDGNIRNRKTGRIIKPQFNRKGYKTMTLRKNKEPRNVRVARVIGDSFYDGNHDEFDICYRDGDRENTAPDNLMFCTRRESVKRSFDSGQRKSVKGIKVKIVETGEVFRSIRACAIALGDETYRLQIVNCLDDPNRTFKGYHFVKHIRH